MKLFFFFALALLFVTVSGAKAQDQAKVVSSCGTAHLTAGTQAFRTVDVNGVTCSGAGSGTTGCSQATAYLARATGEVTHAADLTTLICGLVSDGVWAKLDALYVLAQQTQADAQLNLVSASYGLTPYGSGLTFTSYVGFAGFTIAIGFGTGFDPSIAPSPHYVRDAASLSIWLYSTLSASANSQFGQNTGALNSVIYDEFTNGNFLGGVNSSGFPAVVPSITKGLFSADRADAANVHLYQNGAGASVASASSAIVAGNFLMAPFSNGGGAHGQTLGEAHIGASLGDAGNLALYTRLRTYMTAVGVP